MLASSVHVIVSLARLHMPITCLSVVTDSCSHCWAPLLAKSPPNACCAFSIKLLLSRFCQCFNFFVGFLLKVCCHCWAPWIAKSPPSACCSHCWAPLSEESTPSTSALKRQDLFCTYLAHHKLESVIIIVIVIKHTLQSLHSRHTSSTPSSTYPSRNIGCRKHNAVPKTAHKVHAADTAQPT